MVLSASRGTGCISLQTPNCWLVSICKYWKAVGHHIAYDKHRRLAVARRRTIIELSCGRPNNNQYEKQGLRSQFHHSRAQIEPPTNYFSVWVTMERVGPTLIMRTHPQCELNKMADEEHYIDSEADESEDDRSPAESDSSSEEEEEEYGAEVQRKDMESFINDESDEGEGEGAVAKGEVVNKDQEEEEDVESEERIDAKRRKRGRELWLMPSCHKAV